MPSRHFPVRPNLDQLRHQAKDLLRAIQRNDQAAIADMQTYHPDPPDPASVRLADAQLALARSEEHIRRDPGLLKRTFTHEEIYPPELGCHDEVMATHGTPLAGSTLLHMCADFDEIETARWLLERGMNVDEKAAVDLAGFGGHTALFATVVSQPNFWMNHRGQKLSAPFTRLLLDHGADPNVRASLRKQLHPGYEIAGMHEYRSVTPVSWGQQFHFQKLVSQEAIRMIVERGGQP
jgi:hypothetical protein